MRAGLVLALVLSLLGCAIADNAVDRTVMDVQGTRLFISGEITSRTPAHFQALVEANPQVRTVVPRVMQGSLDDEAVLRMGYFLRSRGLNTHLTARSEIYSGAVDLFVAGNRRTMAQGAVVGVHSWADGFGEGAEYPRDTAEHRANVDYARDMLGSGAFYWFTLQAAPSDGIHIMTRAEIVRFGLVTAGTGIE